MTRSLCFKNCFLWRGSVKEAKTEILTTFLGNPIDVYSSQTDVMNVILYRRITVFHLSKIYLFSLLTEACTHACTDLIYLIFCYSSYNVYKPIYNFKFFTSSVNFSW